MSASGKQRERDERGDEGTEGEGIVYRRRKRRRDGRKEEVTGRVRLRTEGKERDD